MMRVWAWAQVVVRPSVHPKHGRRAFVPKNDAVSLAS
jgi:hypothetical protein